MKINDIEKILGVRRSNIFYYEREGLLTPRRGGNNYRDYSEDDLRRLKTIIVLRKLGLPVTEIAALLSGERALPEALDENLDRLRGQADALENAAAVCRDMVRQGLTMETFDADAWFEAVEDRERRGERFADILADAADDATRTMAFLYERAAVHGPVFALYFLSEEGIRRRRLFKAYWLCIALSCACQFAVNRLTPGGWLSMASPLAAVVYYILLGVAGSLALALCARYVIPRRAPRAAFWLTAAIVLAVSLCLGAVGRQALRRRVDETARGAWLDTVPTGAYTGDDPVGYVRDTWLDGAWDGGELDTYETDGVLFVLTSRGTSFRFLQNDDGTWTETAGHVLRNGRLYTADDLGPHPYPCRLMGADGTVVEPVYEARFSAGYVPVYVIDVPEGQDHAFIEYGTDADGGLRYECIRTDYYFPADGAPQSFDGRALADTAAGADFLAAYRAFRNALLETAPDAALDKAALGQESGFALWAEYIAPPSLTITQESRGASVTWGLNSFDEVIYPGDTPRVIRKQTFTADVAALLDADEVTADMLQAAAASASNAASNALWRLAMPYSTTRIWYVQPPGDLLALADAVLRELNDAAE